MLLIRLYGHRSDHPEQQSHIFISSHTWDGRKPREWAKPKSNWRMIIAKITGGCPLNPAGQWHKMSKCPALRDRWPNTKLKRVKPFAYAIIMCDRLRSWGHFWNGNLGTPALRQSVRVRCVSTSVFRFTAKCLILVFIVYRTASYHRSPSISSWCSTVHISYFISIATGRE